ncbi:hypothetical protein Leryth_000078 [Lithospermum erythrorhizon]|nr:hypothetical protein Leryth_000078 [Lithospermum erythrorhizon]
MDKILNKVGSYWIGKRANKEFNSVGDDINLCTCTLREPSVEIRYGLSLFGNRFWFDECNKEDAKCTKWRNSLSTSIEGGAKWLVGKIKGSMQKPIVEFLKEYDLPAGIFPRDATNYEFNEETKRLTVYIPSICEVGYKDSSVLRFSTIVTGYLEKGKLSEIEGIKTKVIVWGKVTSITSEGSKLHFSAGMKKTRRRDAYEVLRSGVIVDKF